MAQLLSAMVAKLGNMDDPLPQESFEGVDEDEWVSECDGKQLQRLDSIGYRFFAVLLRFILICQRNIIFCLIHL